jgi:hypothetical protein
MITTKVKIPQGSSLLKENSVFNIHAALRNNLFQGDFTAECEKCDAGTGAADYVMLLRYAIHHVVEFHSDVVVIESENEVTFDE